MSRKFSKLLPLLGKLLIVVRTAGLEPARGYPQRILSRHPSSIVFLSGSANSFAMRLGWIDFLSSATDLA